MKRNKYVDSQGNPIDEKFESKKTILRIFFVIGTIIPIILIGIIIYNVIINNNCNNLYSTIKSAAYSYLKDEDNLPTIEGEDTTVALSKLYNNNYLSSLKTDDMVCSGNVKITRYKEEYIYTLTLTNCNYCSTETRYSSWSEETSAYPSNKSNIDVVTYYNYYERGVYTTEWSSWLTEEEISEEESEYGVNMPIDLDDMASIPEEANIISVDTEEKTQYRYADLKWKWYDIEGDYSDYSSEQPDGYANKDEKTAKYTQWSEYSQEAPEEKDYRKIESVKGYIYYYVDDDGNKVYANHKNYTAPDDIDTTIYDQKESGSATMYRYRDQQWRWYNGTKRKYSGYSATKPEGYNYKDSELTNELSYSNWSDESTITDSNKEYRTEEERTLTRFRYNYEILSALVLDEAVTKSEFIDEIDMTTLEFVQLDEYKLEVTYKFKYQKK